MLRSIASMSTLKCCVISKKILTGIVSNKLPLTAFFFLFGTSFFIECVLDNIAIWMFQRLDLVASHKPLLQIGPWVRSLWIHKFSLKEKRERNLLISYRILMFKIITPPSFVRLLSRTFSSEVFIIALFPSPLVVDLLV